MFEPVEAWMTTDNPYLPWHPAKYPRLTREIIGVAWLPDRLRIDISEGGVQAPTVAVSFDLVRAYQGLDEGFRLLDSPVWSAARALIYFSRSSPYLTSVQQNAAGTLDNIDVIHWMITSCNECVDVISECEPTVATLPG
jgi:hypothetical protein